MMRASAISYAIVFALFVGLLASGVFFIFSTQKRIEIVHTTHEHLLLDSYHGIQLGMHQVKVNDSLHYFHTSGDTSIIRKSLWGSYYLVTTHTFKNNFSYSRSALIGSEFEPSIPALVLRSGSNGLWVAGDSFLEGSVYIPEKRVEIAYIGGKNYNNQQLVYGEINETKELKINLARDFENVSAGNFTGNLIPKRFDFKDTTVSFLSEGTYYQSLEAIQLHAKLGGKIILQSFDSVVVYPEAQLTNIILIAPKIVFKQGFTGTLQAFATEKIVLEEAVRLNYPSTLILNEQMPPKSGPDHEINLAANSSVLGGILITTQQYDFRKQPRLSIQKDALVAGIVYNAGITEIYGSIIGSLNTSETLAKVGGGAYTNHVFDALISTKRLPGGFVCPSWFGLFSHSRKKIISCETTS